MDELNGILTWVRNGGLEVARRRAAQRHSERRMLPPVVVQPTVTRGGWTGSGTGSLRGTALEILTWVGVDALFD